MKQYICCYQMFLPGNYSWLKLFLYLVYPLAAIWISLIGVPVGSFSCLIIAPMIMTTVEIMLDYFFFGGIMSKDTNRLEYLITSYRGMACLEKSLVTDSIRRFVSAAVIELGVYFAIGAEIRQADGVSIWHALFFLFVAFLIEELTIGITRYFTGILMNGLLCSVVAAIWLIFMGAFRWFAFEEEIVLTLLFAVLSIGLAVFRIKLTVKRVRRSYYDE